jgi:hypothetical protein
MIPPIAENLGSREPIPGLVIVSVLAMRGVAIREIARSAANGRIMSSWRPL